MVQLLVHVRPADQGRKKNFQLIETTPSATFREVKDQIAQLGRESGAYELPCESQELVFMGERCEDSASVADVGICEDFIVQVTGFVKSEGPMLQSEQGQKGSRMHGGWIILYIDVQCPYHELKSMACVPCQHPSQCTLC
ncbi:hypothetical protein WJX74_001471 [Apatococcus lobatus]|uniref:Ubiquitin-like domain-containing protein n=1 Tax=Apatococcus lobatus TaxID=904363 RepID=A0AAW1RMA8_9CHLO